MRRRGERPVTQEPRRDDSDRLSRRDILRFAVAAPILTTWASLSGAQINRGPRPLIGARRRIPERGRSTTEADEVARGSDAAWNGSMCLEPQPRTSPRVREVGSSTSTRPCLLARGFTAKFRYSECGNRSTSQIPSHDARHYKPPVGEAHAFYGLLTLTRRGRTPAPRSHRAGASAGCSVCGATPRSCSIEGLVGTG
jgi:hypothetical protein